MQTYTRANLEVATFARNMLREVVFEQIRKEEYPNCLSRQQAVFGCRTLQELLAYVMETGREAEGLYEVTPVSKQTAVQLGSWDMTAISAMSPSNHFYPTLLAVARQYWGTAPIHKVEVLMGGPVRITKVIRPPETETPTA